MAGLTLGTDLGLFRTMVNTHALAAGTEIAGYVVLGELGRGGFGITYEAINPVTRRRAAIKEFYPAKHAQRGEDGSVAFDEAARELADLFLRKFRDTTSVLSALHHPNIVGVQNYLASNGTGYMFMDFIEGRSLSSIFLERDTLSASELERIVAGITSALAYIHERRLVHRDIAPDNILVRLDGSPVLIDFGALKQIEYEVEELITESKPRQQITTGYDISKRFFSAPELYFDPSKIGPEADIYSLGAVIYQALFGRPPADATVRSLKLVSNSRDPVAEYSAPLSVDGSVIATVLKALDMLPENRPSIAEMARLFCSPGRSDAIVKSDLNLTIIENSLVKEVGEAVVADAMSNQFAALQLGSAYNRPRQGELSLSERGGSIGDGSDLKVEKITTIEANSSTPKTNKALEDKPAEAHFSAKTTRALLLGISAIGSVGLAWFWVSGGNLAGYPQSGFAQNVCPQTTVLKATEPLAPDRERCLGTGSEFKECVDCPVMVVVPAGSFLMGSPYDEAGRESDEGPLRRVTINRRLAAGKYTVTVAEFSAFVKATGHSAGAACSTWANKWVETQGNNWRYPGFYQSDNHPVVCVNWNDAQSYVDWLSKFTGKKYRLLTEAEWEYSARAGTTTPFWWGSNISTDQANYNGEYTYGAGSKGASRGRTVPVDFFLANPFGLYQVHGNVFQWVEDCYTGGYHIEPADGLARRTANCTAHVLRGGAWLYPPSTLRSAYRQRAETNARIDNVGFRVARTLLD